MEGLSKDSDVDRRASALADGDVSLRPSAVNRREVDGPLVFEEGAADLSLNSISHAVGGHAYVECGLGVGGCDGSRRRVEDAGGESGSWLGGHLVPYGHVVRRDASEFRELVRGAESHHHVAKTKFAHRRPVAFEEYWVEIQQVLDVDQIRVVSEKVVEVEAVVECFF